MVCCDLRSIWKSNLDIFICLRDLNFNSGSLHFKDILEIERHFSLRAYVFFDMLPGSEIQRWLGANLRSFWNSKNDFLAEIIFFAVCLRDLKFNSGLLLFMVILEIKF